MFEVRVLNGLHQGAAFPLFGEQWCIGAGAEADLALNDPGIAPRHVSLRRAGQHWCVQAEEGLVLDASGQMVAQIAELGLDVSFSIAGIALCVSLTDQPWPVKREASPVAPAPVAQAASQLPLSTLSTSAQKRLMALLLVIAVLVTAVGMLNSEDRQAQASLEAPENHKVDLATVPEVRDQLLKMLNERELTTRVSISAANGQVSLNGNVSLEEMAVVTRMLRRFGEQYATPVSVISRVREGSEPAPFKIVQIVGGPHGHVVLDSGQRLFVGDEVDGLRLVSIDNVKVVFDGRQRYEVRW